MSEAQERRERDAVELAARVSGLPAYEGQAARGVLGIVSPLKDGLGGDFPQFTIATVELDGPLGHGSCARLFIEADEENIRRALWEDPTRLFSRYGVSQERTALGWSSGVLSGALADLLGYGEGEIETWALQMALRARGSD